MLKALSQLKLEVKLLFANKFFILLPLLFGLWMFQSLAKISGLAELSLPPSQDLYTFVYSFHKIQHVLSLGAAVMIGILLIRRDLRRPAYEWIASLPFSGAMLIAIKFIAGLLYLSTFTVAMNLVYIYFAIQRELPAGVIRDQSLFFTLQYEWSYAVTLMLAMFIGLVIRNRIAYMIGFCAWMFGTFFLDVFLIAREGLYGLKPFHLSQFRMDSPFENEVWGYSINHLEIWLVRLFIFAFTLLLLVWMIALYKQERPSQSASRWKWLSIGVLLLAIAAYIPYGHLWNYRLAANTALAQDAPTLGTYENDYTLIRFDVDAYDLKLKRVKDQLSVKAELTFPASDITQQLPLTFTLNRTFQLQKVLLNGIQIQYERNDDWISLDPALIDKQRVNQVITMEYTGAIMDWSKEGDHETLLSFVQGPNIYLPPEAFWYPQPGNHHLWVKSDQSDLIMQSNYNEPLHSANFTLSLQGFHSHVYATMNPMVSDDSQTKRFEQKATKSITLFGGNLIDVTKNGEPLKVITSPSNKLEAEKFLNNLSAARRYYASWLSLDSAQLKQIYYIPLALARGSNYWNDQKLIGNSYVMGELRGQNLDYIQENRVLTALLFADAGFRNTAYIGGTPPKIIFQGKIQQAILYMYYRDYMKLSDEQLKAKYYMNTTPLFSDTEVNDIGLKFIEMINQAIGQGKSTEVKAVLSFFYTKLMTNMDEKDPFGKQGLLEWQQEWDRVMNHG
jgi:hypothetical protein